MDDRFEMVKKWAEYIRSSNGKWRKIHNEFITAQFDMAQSFIRRLAEQPGGKEKIIKLYGIKNKKAFPKLLKGMKQ